MKSRIIASRGTGKTRELMRLALENNGIFVCQNARHMKEKAANYGLHGLQIISFEDFINNIQDYPVSYAEGVTVRGYKNEQQCPIYIDEIEGFVNFLCLNTFAGYSLSLE